MSGLVIVGAQWGDEGKGKIVDYITEYAKCVVRFQGGNNAGHTLVVDGCTTKLSLIPSGILQNGTVCLIAAGVVVDPEVVFNEIEQLEKAGLVITPDRLKIDRDCHLVLEYHRALDLAKEVYRGAAKIGTTGRGIGPAYADRAARTGVRFCDLEHLDRLEERVRENVTFANRYIKSVLGANQEVQFEIVWESLQKAAERLLPFLGNVSLLLSKELAKNSKVVYEGAQGTLLDQIHGTIPYVTSSNTIAGAVTTGCGIGPQGIKHVLGVTKAYCTRVGSGPFPTELNCEIGQLIGRKGHEFGTVTGRARRCGWLDLFALKRASRLNGFNSLAITKLDVLSGIEQLRVCTGYKLGGKLLEDFPAHAFELNEVEVEYLDFEPWSVDLMACNSYVELPAQVKKFLVFIEEYLDCPVSIISVGPERHQTIIDPKADFIKSYIQEV
jgi:adenylosuccinate synthase